MCVCVCVEVEGGMMGVWGVRYLNVRSQQLHTYWQFC